MCALVFLLFAAQPCASPHQRGQWVGAARPTPTELLRAARTLHAQLDARYHADKYAPPHSTRHARLAAAHAARRYGDHEVRAANCT